MVFISSAARVPNFYADERNLLYRNVNTCHRRVYLSSECINYAIIKIWLARSREESGDDLSIFSLILEIIFE